VIDVYLRETARVLKPGGRFVVFSNTRERSPLQPAIDLSRKLGQLFVRLGVYDFEREARRKSDHLKALETWEDVLDAMQQAGLKPVRAVFWNSLFTTFVEHVLMKLGEAIVGRTRPTPRHVVATAPSSDQTNGTQREIRARQRFRGYLQRRGAVYYGLQAVTLMMELDLWLFGWMRNGSYFLLVEKE